MNDSRILRLPTEALMIGESRARLLATLCPSQRMSVHGSRGKAASVCQGYPSGEGDTVQLALEIVGNTANPSKTGIRKNLQLLCVCHFQLIWYIGLDSNRLYGAERSSNVAMFTT